MIVGLTGTFSSGKDMVARHLEARGFSHVSTGDLVRKEALKRRLPLTRESLQNLGNRLRRENGPGYLARLALAECPDDVVVSGLRNLGEREVLKSRAPFGFVMVSIDAPVEKRYEWATSSRKRLTDGVDFATFVRQQEYERGHDPSGLQLGQVMAIAEVQIKNNGALEELDQKVDLALRDFIYRRSLKTRGYFFEKIWRRCGAISWPI